MLHCLGNNDKKKVCLCLVQKQSICLNIFDPQLVDSVDVGTCEYVAPCWVSNVYLSFSLLKDLSHYLVLSSLTYT
jgi:hypothetical protein